MYVKTDSYGSGWPAQTDLAAAVPRSWDAGWGSRGLGQPDSGFENIASGIALLVFGAAAWSIYKAYKRA
jgi:hypothetical protein